MYSLEQDARNRRLRWSNFPVIRRAVEDRGADYGRHPAGRIIQQALESRLPAGVLLDRSYPVIRSNSRVITSSYADRQCANRNQHNGGT